MRYFRHESPNAEVTLYPLVCLHVGVSQCAESFIKEHVARIVADPTALAVYMGDAGECTIRESKGDIYSQGLNPGQQLDKAVELLAPLGERLLFGIRGNHGARIYKATGLDWDEQLCTKLGIPYLGTAALMRLDLKNYIGNNTPYDLYFHHGAGCGIAMGSKVTKALGFNRLVRADAVFTAHSHVCLESPPENVAYLPRTKREVAWHTTFNYICGCAYDSRDSYAEEKGYPPITPAYLGVKFDAIKSGHGSRKQSCQIWRAEL